MSALAIKPVEAASASSALTADASSTDIPRRAIGSDTRIRRLFLGKLETADALERILREEAPSLVGKVTVCLEPVLAIDKTKKKHVFSRDWGVTLLNGSLLAPYCLRSPKYMRIIREDRSPHPDPLSQYYSTCLAINTHLQALCPFDFFDFTDLPFGTGFLHAADKQIQDSIRASGQKVLQAHTCIEGGNCFLFMGSDGKPRAIIGMTSVMLSLLALEEQNYFTTSLLTKKKEAITTLSDEFVRMARNHPLYQQKAEAELHLSDIHETNGIEWEAKFIEIENHKTTYTNPTSEFWTKIRAPLSHEDRFLFADAALELQAKWALTEELMAHELGIPYEEGKLYERMAILRQKEFHIDLEMFKGPGNKIFLNDDRLVIAECEKIVPTSSIYCAPGMYENNDKEKYKATSLARYKKLRALQEPNETSLKRIGCEVAYVPGYFRPQERIAARAINFMNGILLEDPSTNPCFVVLDNSSTPYLGKQLQAAFEACMRVADPSLRILFIDMKHPDFFQDTRGGLRCLTREVSI